MKASRIELFAEDHHGVVTRSIAAPYGVSNSSWYRAIESGALEPLHPNVSRVAGSPRTRRQAILAAVFAAGPDALASHRTAAMLHGIERPDTDPIEAFQPDRDRRVVLDGVVIHHPRDQLDLKRVLHDNIPTTGLLRLLCDLGAVDEAGVFPGPGI